MKTYTFKVSLADDEDIWRKIELPASWTLEDLHYTIQDAFEFDGSHLYSFFMSGEAWDSSTEYTLTDDEDFGEELSDEDTEEWSMDDLDAPVIASDDEDVSNTEATIGGIARDGVSSDSTEMPVSLDQLSEQPAESQPTPADIRALLAELKNNPELRAEMTRQLSEQAGIPPAMADMVLSNADSLLSMLPDEMVQQLMGPLGGQFDDNEEVAGDVREVQLDQLELAVGKEFLYIYDFGDDWEFDVQVEAVNDSDVTEDELPRLIDAAGEAPSQYEDGEEDDEDESA
jgi:hypothetical protein